MDTITHGVAGALIGKALFRGEDLLSRREMNRARVITWAMTLGAIFPDSDTIRDMFSSNDMLMITWHRGITHSLLCLPIFAVLLALLTQWFARWRKWESPSLPVLIGIYAAGISSHIFLDLVTSFGTMIWSPLEWSRPAWDLLFIVDFSFTGILLIPQLLEWVNRDSLHAKRRALMMWVIFVPAPFLIAYIGRIVGAPISDAGVILASLSFSLIFLLPAFRGWGARIKPVAWNRGGFAVASVYLLLALYGHHVALERVQSFLELEKIAPESFAALPYPPSLLNWDGLVRTSRGVYEVPIDLSKRNSFAGEKGASLSDSNAPSIEYKYSPDAPLNLWIMRAKRLPEVQKVLWFARFPVTQFHMENGEAIVDISDLRFPRMRPDRPAAFTYRVRFDASGNVVSQGWRR
ncbi:MAG: metal-dependent hydrolase [Acidobacteria bacterium]|nr:metal-dependent hydrolase [Acidobacteriota bacterium]MBS1864291.1 metal-dependent hydrolase [Acidobacteriota bacterium]